MIANGYLRTMSRYNRWQNNETFAAALSLSDELRREDRGGFWKSIHGTLSHIFWADRIWLSRFDLAEPPNVPLNESDQFVEDFEELAKHRIDLDDLLVRWCDDYQKGAVAGDLEWFSGAANKHVKAPLAMILVHFFNHQTHHRGQVTAMLTAVGCKTTDTDLFLMPAHLWPS